jgi:hypothetical protein
MSAYDPRLGGPLVWLAEIEAALDGGALPVAGPAWADDPWAAEPLSFASVGLAETIWVSDLGYRDTQSYPPLLVGGPDIERRVALAPGAADTFAWGSLRLAAPGLIANASLTGRDTALRRVRIRAGLRGWDSTRGIQTDPPAAGLVDAFLGMALTWQARVDGADVPLRDPSAWLDAPIGIRKFLGTGGAEGPAELAGTPFPIVRGGTVSSPVRNIPVVLVNAASRIYRWTDGASTLVQVYEDGAPVYTNAGNVADVFASGSPSAGAFYSSNAQGMIRLGSDPAGTITVDGAGGSGPLVTAVLRDLIMTTLALPAGYLDETSVTSTAVTAAYTGGWAWTGQESGREAIKPLLAALGARLIASRSGGLRLWPLRALGSTTSPVASLDPTTAVSMAAVPMGGPLTPPAAFWSVGYARTHSTTTTPKPTVSATERERLAKPYRTAVWSDATNLTRYAQASRPDMVATALLQQADAQSLANSLGALWGVQRSLWQVTLPTASALLREIGDVVTLQWPADGLRTGALGQVVGDSLRAGDPTASLLVLV